jgi:hypothetical protein
VRIQNLKEPQAPVVVAAEPPATAHERPAPLQAASSDRQAVEIAFLKARIQHLELVLETARSLMGSNHQRLLRRLNDVPHEMIQLSAQLRRFDPDTTR